MNPDQHPENINVPPISGLDELWFDAAFGLLGADLEVGERVRATLPVETSQGTIQPGQLGTVVKIMLQEEGLEYDYSVVFDSLSIPEPPLSIPLDDPASAADALWAMGLTLDPRNNVKVLYPNAARCDRREIDRAD